MSEGRLVVSVTEAAEMLGISVARLRTGASWPDALASPRPASGRTSRCSVDLAGTGHPGREPTREKGAVVTSERFHYLAQMVFEAADYLGDHDRVAREQLLEAGTLLTAIGDWEAATEDGDTCKPSCQAWDEDRCQYRSSDCLSDEGDRGSLRRYAPHPGSRLCWGS